MPLTKADIVNAIHSNTGFTKQKSIDLFETLLNLIKGTLASGEDALVSDFGKFCVKKKGGRRGLKILLPFIFALVFLSTNANFSTAAIAQKPLLVKVGAYQNPPKIYKNSKGRISGFWPDLIEHIAKIENWKIEYVWGSWDEGLDRLKNKEIDIMPDVAFTKKRSGLFTFSKAPVLSSWVRVYVNKDETGIHAITDLKDKKIAVLRGAANLDSRRGFKQIDREFHLNCTFLELNSYMEVFKAVEDKRADAGIANRDFGNKYAEKFRVKRTPIVFFPFDLKFAFPKDGEKTPLLVKQINDSMTNLEKNDTSVYYRLLKKYFESEVGSKKVFILPGWLKKAMEIGVFFLLFFILVIIFSRIQVRKRTHEIEIKNEALQESEKKYRAIFDNAQVGMYRVRLSDGKILLANDRLAEMLGYGTAEEAVADYVFSEPYVDPKAFGRLMAIIREQSNFNNFETPVTRRDNSICWVLTSGRVFPEKGYAEGVVTDITEKKQAQEILRQSEERYSVLVEESFDGILVQKGQKIVFANRHLHEMLGYDQGDLVGMDHWLVCHPEYQELTRERALNRLRGEEASGRYEVKMQRKDASWFYAEVSARLITLEGEPGIQIWVRDITERKKAEEENKKLEAQLNQAQKMEVVGQLAGGVAHDYNNILTVILGYTEMTLEKLDHSGFLYDNLNQILIAAKRSYEITRQLLAFARKQTIAPKVLDVNQIVENMLTMLRQLIGEEVDVAWLPDAQPWHTKIDPSQLEQIVTNLCVNARDAISGVGKITIETKKVVFDHAYCVGNPGFVPGEFVMLAASDDGCGMDKRTLEHIFEPFFTTKQVGLGTGLGLSTVFGIVKQNGGFINVYSEPYKGTTVKIYLPHHVSTTETITLETTVSEAPTGHGERVLLVEDNLAILKMGQKMLEELGYLVLSAGTPGEALLIAGEHENDIQLLITDVVMPDMNGRELSKQLRKLYPGIKTLFMSGYTANVIAHRGVLDEGVQFIPKPFSIKDLGVKIRLVLDEK